MTRPIEATDPKDAIRTIMACGGPRNPGSSPQDSPSRVMVITLGENPTPVDWPHFFGEYIGYQLGNDEG